MCGREGGCGAQPQAALGRVVALSLHSTMEGRKGRRGHNSPGKGDACSPTARSIRDHRPPGSRRTPPQPWEEGDLWGQTSLAKKGNYEKGKLSVPKATNQSRGSMVRPL